MLAISLIKECLQTILCLEFKPQCIAAGSVAIAAEFLKVPTPSTGLLQMNGKFWWHETSSRNPSARSCKWSDSIYSTWYISKDVIVNVLRNSSSILSKPLFTVFKGRKGMVGSVVL
ncbi:hypothetical protein ACFX11_037959 [Malus domestica]